MCRTAPPSLDNPALRPKPIQACGSGRLRRRRGRHNTQQNLLLPPKCRAERFQDDFCASADSLFVKFRIRTGNVTTRAKMTHRVKTERGKNKVLAEKKMNCNQLKMEEIPGKNRFHRALLKQRGIADTMAVALC